MLYIFITEIYSVSLYLYRNVRENLCTYFTVCKAVNYTKREAIVIKIYSSTPLYVALFLISYDRHSSLYQMIPLSYSQAHQYQNY